MSVLKFEELSQPNPIERLRQAQLAVVNVAKEDVATFRLEVAILTDHARAIVANEPAYPPGVVTEARRLERELAATAQTMRRLIGY